MISFPIEILKMVHLTQFIKRWSVPVILMIGMIPITNFQDDCFRWFVLHSWKYPKILRTHAPLLARADNKTWTNFSNDWNGSDPRASRQFNMQYLSEKNVILCLICAKLARILEISSLGRKNWVVFKKVAGKAFRNEKHGLIIYWLADLMIG